jgi:hypothetical protein
MGHGIGLPAARPAIPGPWCDLSERSSTSSGQPPVARVHVIRGLCRLRDDDDLHGGVALCERDLAQPREAGQLRRYAHDLAVYATYLAVVGDHPRADDIAAEPVALARVIGDEATLAIALKRSSIRTCWSSRRSRRPSEPRPT